MATDQKTEKPVIYFDALKDSIYPTGCWLCGIAKDQDKGCGKTPVEAYEDWLKIVEIAK